MISDFATYVQPSVNLAPARLARYRNKMRKTIVRKTLSPLVGEGGADKVRAG